eukprot:4829705-Amphidinium_carterae.2
MTVPTLFHDAFVVRLCSTDDARTRARAPQGQEREPLVSVPQVAALQCCVACFRERCETGAQPAFTMVVCGSMWWISRRGCQKRNWPVLTGGDELPMTRLPLRKQAVLTWLILTGTATNQLPRMSGCGVW